MKSPSPPAAPDPAATAAAQSAANKDTAVAQARLNNVNQVDAYGNKLTYTAGPEVGGVPQYTATQTFSPEQQVLADKQIGIYGQGLDTAQSLFNNAQSSLSAPAPTFDDAYRTQQMNAILQRQQPQLDRDRSALQQQLANQGVSIGSTAYNDAMNQFDQRVNDLNLAADTQAGNEARAQYQTTLAGRSQPINEISALLGLGQVQSPNIVSTAQTGIAPTDVLGATSLGYQGAMNTYNQKMASRNATIGAIAGLGGAALGGWAQGGFALSDVRTKKNIQHIGFTKVSVPVPVYKYDYKWEGDGQKHVGVMAQELEQVRPDAVHDLGGVKAVDYGAI